MSIEKINVSEKEVYYDVNNAINDNLTEIQTSLKKVVESQSERNEKINQQLDDIEKELYDNNNKLIRLNSERAFREKEIIKRINILESNFNKVNTFNKYVLFAFVINFIVLFYLLFF